MIRQRPAVRTTDQVLKAIHEGTVKHHASKRIDAYHGSRRRYVEYIRKQVLNTYRKHGHTWGPMHQEELEQWLQKPYCRMQWCKKPYAPAGA